MQRVFTAFEGGCVSGVTFTPGRPTEITEATEIVESALHGFL
jgi:hypothetical protein